MLDWIQITILSVHFALAIWAFVDLRKNSRFEGGLRWMAGITILVFPIFGPLIYFTIRDAKPKNRF